MTRPVLLAAPVSGFAAFVLAGVLEEQLPTRMVRLRQLVESGRLHPEYLGQVAAQWAAIREAGQQWKEHRAAVDGSTAEALTAAVPDLSEIDTAGAAELLAVSPNRVRQLLRAGHLNGRKTSRTWLVDRKDVELQREAAGGSLRRNERAFP